MDHNATNSPIPQHIRQFFTEDGVEFSSDFDSGNLGRVERSSNRSYLLWIGPDCMNTQTENTCRSWFYFKVTVSQPQTIYFLIKNMNHQFKVFREGMKPVWKINDRWERIPSPVTFNMNDDDQNSMELGFSLQICKECYLAFTYPWSISENKELLNSIKETCTRESIYFHQENLINSLENRECELLTISSLIGIQDETEKSIQFLYPGSSERSRTFFGKKYVLITSRVHPGETQGLYMMNGFLKFLVSDDPRAVGLRENFIFKIIPILNPDGVYRGHYRTDTRGVNLNRFYTNPSLTDHPTVFAAKKIFMNFKDNLYCYIDLHGHATKKGCFVYGNYMEFSKEIECYLFAKLLSLNCINFDFEGSNFTEKNMRAKDKRGLSKEGSGRVALFKSSGLPRCYTLECNFNTGKVLNPIISSGLPEPEECNNLNSIYSKQPVEYNIGIYEDVGRAIGVSLLDSILRNPYSRILTNDPELKKLKIEVATYIANQAPFKFNPMIKKASKNKEDLTKFINDGCKKVNVDKKVSIAKTSEIIRAPRVSRTLQPKGTEYEIRPSKRIIISDSQKKEDSNFLKLSTYSFVDHIKK